MNPTPDPAVPALAIDFVSDVSCPWCVIGLYALRSALQRSGRVAEIRFQPFELNPQLGPEGEALLPHLQAKYGITPGQIAENQQRIHARGAELGFAFGPRERIWNTFDAHRLLHAAGEQDLGTQGRLKQALLSAYHGEGLNPSDPELLRRCAVQAGLREVDAVLADPQRHAQAVRDAQAFWRSAGIQAVPAVVFGRRQVVSGGQPVEVFEQVLRGL